MSARAVRTAMALALLLSVATDRAPAQSSGGPYSIPRQSIDAGAGRSDSASYAIDGSLGQPDAGATMQGATYSVRGGFLPRELPAPVEPLFADGFE